MLLSLEHIIRQGRLFWGSLSVSLSGLVLLLSFVQNESQLPFIVGGPTF